MKHRFIRRVVAAACLLAAVSQHACKEGTLINSKIAPSNNNIGVYESTLGCITRTVYNDTVVTSSIYSGVPAIHGVGLMNESFFGTMAGASFFQVVPKNFTSLIYADATIDSAVLVLPFSGFVYGDATNDTIRQSYQVFYMQDSLGLYTPYFSYSTKAIETASPLSDPTPVNIARLKDSLYVTGANHAGLRIKLKLPALRAKLDPALQVLANSASPTAADFVNAFRGICVRVADLTWSVNAYPYFQLDGTDQYSRAGFLVYYRKNNNPTETVIEPYSFFGDACAHFNSVSKSYSRAPVNNLLQSAQLNDSIIALQNLPGACLDVKITGIKGLPKGIIQKADLLLSILPGDYNPSIYTAPTRINVRGLANGTYPTGIVKGSQYPVADAIGRGSSLSFIAVLDGSAHTYTYGTEKVNAYTIGLPREITQCIEAGNDTLHLRITGTDAYYDALNFFGGYHLVAGGGNYSNPNYRAKLKVVYSKLN